MNFDNRSLALNDEATLRMRDGPFAARLELLFELDLRNATEIDASVFAQRPWVQHVAEWASKLIARLP